MRHGQTVDNGHADGDKQVGHLSYWHRLGAVADHSEDGEQTEREAHAEVDVVEQEHQHEHRHAEEHEGVVIVLPFGFSVIEEMHHYPAYQQVKAKKNRKGDKALLLEDGHAQQVVGGGDFL